METVLSDQCYSESGLRTSNICIVRALVRHRFKSKVSIHFRAGPRNLYFKKLSDSPSLRSTGVDGATSSIYFGAEAETAKPVES